MACDCQCKVNLWHCGVLHEVPSDENGDISVTLDTIVEPYTGAAPPAPPAPAVDPGNPGLIPVLRLAQDPAGDITHIDVCGTYQQIAAAGSGLATEQVCYDPNTWTFPVTYGALNGSWTVAGFDRMLLDTCAISPSTFNVVEAQRANDFSDYKAEQNFDWASATWVPEPAAEGVGGIVEGRVGVDPVRDTVRCRFNVPTNFESTDHIWEVNFRIPVAGGNIGFTAWHPGIDANLDVEYFTGPGLFTNYGKIVKVSTGHGSPIGLYTFGVDTTGISTFSDIEFVVSSLNASGPEDVDTISLATTGRTNDACFTWNTLEELRVWAESRDPYEHSGWYISGSAVCVDVPVGLGQHYGDLVNSLGQTITPTVV